MEEPGFKFEKGVPIGDKPIGDGSIGDKKESASKAKIVFGKSGENYTPSEIKKIKEQRMGDPTHRMEQE